MMHNKAKVVSRFFRRFAGVCAGIFSFLQPVVIQTADAEQYEAGNEQEKITDIDRADQAALDILEMPEDGQVFKQFAALVVHAGCPVQNPQQQ